MNCATEWIESYRPGNLHPVHFEDTFKDGQYRVLRKLGCGSFSTVWLARDQINHRIVALKIQAAGKYARPTEVSMFRHLSREASPHPGAKHINTLLDTFEHRGPNGTHVVLVIEAMGPTVNSMASHLGSNPPARRSSCAKYPLEMARVMLKHTLLAVDFLHQQGITHGDLQPGNLLFAIAGLDGLSEDQLRGARHLSRVRRLDRKEDRWAPRYLAHDDPLIELVPQGPDHLTIKLSDMGSVFWSDDPPETLVTPLGLRAPEIVLRGKITPAIDIWTFGCLVFELITGSPLLFVSPPWDEDDDVDADDEHLLGMHDVLGPLPSHVLSKWARTDIHFDQNGDRILKVYRAGSHGDYGRYHFENSPPPEAGVQSDARDCTAAYYIKKYDMKFADGEQSSGSDHEEPFKLPQIRGPDDPPWVMPEKEAGPVDGDLLMFGDPMEQTLAKEKPSAMDDEELAQLISLLHLALQYDAKDRPSASQLLQHSWFAERDTKGPMP